MAALSPDVQDYKDAHDEVVRVAGLFLTFIIAANARIPDMPTIIAASQVYGSNAYYLYNTWNNNAGKAFKTNLYSLFNAEFTGEVLKAYEAYVAALP